MTISKRTLEKWRKEALKYSECTDDRLPTISEKYFRHMLQIILTMSQKLLDQHLLNK